MGPGLKTICVIGLLLLFLSSCNNKKVNNEVIDQNGIWQSIGYGRILVIDSSDYHFYDYTTTYCGLKKEGQTDKLSTSISIKNDTLLYSIGFDIYKFVRINNLPKICKDSLRKVDPEYVFEVFGETINEHYAYFDLNYIDFELILPDFKEKINKGTSESELYQIMEELIDTIKDNHGYIEPVNVVIDRTSNTSSNSHEVEEIGDFVVASKIASTYLDSDLTEDSKVIRWGIMKNGFGYLQVNAMWLNAKLNIPDSVVKEFGFVDAYLNHISELSEFEATNAEVAGTKKIISRAISDLRNTPAVILDVRFNGGGNDDVSIEILRHFNDQNKLVASKCARAGNKLTEPLPIYLPASQDPYLKPVYLLTSQQSASATDFLALCSMSLDNFIRIGSPTQGAISDALEKQLPNGWYFSISNELYFDPWGNCYENIGIPVHYELFYPEDRQQFFKMLYNNPEKDLQKTLESIKKISNRTINNYSNYPL
ncbi:S41 family peptidase [Marinigracilibium pacificum]|uniref:S41 family peptidase n=1 Tax=Marinigracilibium pacificum TaxID=2729599 RepID=A0A848IT17_9BACT|nr:S41 family peptidase [Marinigracilibium pacificum]NMM47603.1 S41 family peptidase [Marinigracilibium pacificum]